MQLQLTISSGTLAGRSFDLQTGFITIGRSETCSVRLDPLTERIASKQHAFIEARADGFYLTDNKSTNGTLVNGQRIESSRLNDGDEIQLGANGVTARVSIKGSTAPELASPQFQLEQFNQIAAQEPVNLSASIQNFAVPSMAAVKPEPSSTGRYIGIGVTIFAIIFMALIVLHIMHASVWFFPAVIAGFVAFITACL